MGIRALAGEVAEPMRAIIGNAVLEVAPIVHEARRRAAGHVQECVFDIPSSRMVDGWSGGIVDPLSVVLAVESSVGTAGGVLHSLRSLRPFG